MENGTIVNQYKIISPIGKGGMGEVFRARDARLERDVAIKVLPAEFAGDEDRLQRFMQEARATSALNHPNILTVYDIGEHDGSPFIVSELLEGEELRQRLDEGSIPLRKVTEYAQQIVSGLSAAHEKGIVHRDLKPENLFITNDERVKILDFGLAKLREASTNIHGSEDATRKAMTHPGMVMGTVGYMSPEQVRGNVVDHRSDIFSFGVILYEMITGRRAFQEESLAETMSAIVKEEPPEITESNPNISPSLERIVRRCLEKKPDRRFQSTADLGFALESLSAPTSSSGHTMTTTESGISSEIVPQGRRRILKLAAALLVLAVIVLGIWYFVRGWLTPMAASVAEVSFQPLTFENGFVFVARFAPDGRTIVYSADWEGQPRNVYVTSLDSTEYRSLELPGSDLLGISPAGELAILNGSKVMGGSPYRRIGMLARASLTGRSSRPELDGVSFADFGPKDTLAVSRVEDGRPKLEYPVGQTLAEQTGVGSQTGIGMLAFAAPRVSPSGANVGFFDLRVEYGYRVKIVDRLGKSLAESGPYNDWWSLAWRSPNELWFAAAETGGTQTSIFSLDLAGNRRTVFRAPGSITLHDISTKGDVLVSFDRSVDVIELVEGSDPVPRDRSWRESGSPGGFSANHTLLINGSGDSGGPNGAVYVWGAKDAQPVRISDGIGLALSSDGSKALVSSVTSPPTITIVPTGAGKPQIVDMGQVESVTSGYWLPDGRIAICALLKDSDMRVYTLSPDGRDPKLLLPPGVTFPARRGKAGYNRVSPDGTRIFAVDAAGTSVICNIATQVCAPIPGMLDGDIIAGWSSDSTSLFVYQSQPVQVQIDRLDTNSGRRSLWKAVRPLKASASGISALYVSPDGAIVYSYQRDASQLYVIKGLR